MSRLAGLTFILALLLAAPLCADDQGAEVADLIGQLASKQWSVREKAQRRLVAIGEPAREKLRDALVNDDPEVRSRASAALIAIGESFAYALECAQDKADGKREHGKAALMSLFRLDDEETLARVSNDNANRYGYYYRQRRENQPPLSCAPPLAIATIEAVSGFPILVAAQAKASWATVMQAAAISLDLNNGVDQVEMATAQVNELMYRVLGSNDATNAGRPVALPMRIGQFNFIMISTVAAMNDAARAATSQLLSDFIAGGLPGMRAARLLAAGLSGDPAAFTRLTDEFTKNPRDSLLAFVALHGELEDATRKLVVEAARPQLAMLLASRDWLGLTLAAMVLPLLAEKERAAILDPILATSDDSLQFEAALWCARGCELSAEARARVAKCISNKQDGIASCAARWLAAAKQVSDDELALVWKAAETLPVGSAFFLSTLELISRDDVRPRLVARAREALSGRFDTQQALAAVVLRGNATAADLAQIVEKLRNLQNNTLVGRLCLLFEGAKELGDAAITKMADGLCDNDANKRRRFLRALRKCAPELRAKVIAASEKKISELPEKMASALSARGAKLAFAGLKSGAGDVKALDDILAAANSNEPEIVKAASAALVDALDADGLASTLTALKKKNPGKFNEIATAVHLEQCRRAVEENDSDAFRVAASRVNALQAMGWNWQIMQELAQMESELDPDSGSTQATPLPRHPLLTALTVEVK
jgi:hypothetical protein